MIHYLVFIYLIFLAGCISTSQKNYKFIENSEVINQNPKKMLTPGQVNHDTQQIIYALDTAYSGKKFLPAGEYDTLLKSLSSMNESTSAIDFCEKLGRLMEPISDNHLSAKFNNKHCFPKRNRRKAQVGKNFYSAVKDIPWNTTLMKQSKKTALVISVTKFPSRSSPVWTGFIDEVKSRLPKSNFVILDLRGNGGGDDATGFQLATLLAGAELKQPYTKQWNSPSAEAQQVFVNTFDYLARADLELGRNPEPYILELKNKFIKERDRIINNLPETNQSNDGGAGQDFVLEKSIRKPIYILIDAGCASSCESTIDFFEFNPLAKTVGENTAGYVHFGNNGTVFLQNSGIEIQLATSYNGYEDGRFLEKVGLKPMIGVPPGKDALDFAWSHFLGRK